jgi:hypothetical protein
MARPRKNDPTSLIAPILEDFARKIAAAVEQKTIAQIAQVLKAAGRGAKRRRKRTPTLCYAPGCRNIAAPRFGMFCAAEHKRLPKAEKLRIRDKRARELVVRA